jgi:hypothetical protein
VKVLFTSAGFEGGFLSSAGYDRLFMNAASLEVLEDGS